MASSPISPVTDVLANDEPRLENGIALCLSGGGYRAMLFHLGSIWRLAEMGMFDPNDRNANLPDGSTVAIGRIQRISSVSGGSIVSALLGMSWDQIQFGAEGALDRFKTLVVNPIRNLSGISLAGTDLRGVVAVIGDILLPGSVNDHVAAAYDKHLYRGATLQALPDWPRFVINASNLQSGALMRFMKPYIRDWRVGEIKDTGKVSLAKAVAASSAFPPILAPATFKFAEADYTPGSGVANFQVPPFTTAPTLADGGVYDNLGLETAYKRYRTLLVSNAGAPFAQQPEVHHDWARLGQRVIDLIDNQVGSLRKRLLVQSFQQRLRLGALWDINQAIDAFTLNDSLACPMANTQLLAHLGTDLSAKDPALQCRLINWGYAIADTAIRAYFDRFALPAPQFPLPDGV